MSFSKGTTVGYMSVWVVALGAGLVYCVQKRSQLVGIQERAMAEYYKPGEPSGTVSTSEVRAAWMMTDDTRYQDMSTDLTQGQKEKLDRGTRELEREALSFDSTEVPLKIEGVPLH